MKSTRKEAKEAGDKFYFNGNPCCNGHVALRNTLSGGCVTCVTERSKVFGKTEKRKQYIANNRDKFNQGSKKYRERHKGKVNALHRSHVAGKMKRTPTWLTEEDKTRIKCYYQVAAMRTRESDQKWHVDHIVPLQGENVSGLHVPWNLRVIPAVENIKKGNKFDNS